LWQEQPSPPHRHPLDARSVGAGRRFQAFDGGNAGVLHIELASHAQAGHRSALGPGEHLHVLVGAVGVVGQPQHRPLLIVQAQGEQLRRPVRTLVGRELPGREQALLAA
jgi:hypothetical protein